MTIDKIELFQSDKKKGQRELPPVELTKELLDSVRHIEGYPIGTDEDIIKLSDPPYYTACPNPFIGDFIKKYGKPFDEEKDNYHREPFAADVSEGKNDPIYNAHSYHTKVPHKAIMRYILHYTEPGDIVFDGFCGTGMTGVAAQLCGDRKTVESLGYRVKDDGTILQETQEGDKIVWKPFSKLGARRAILNDLSPAATFIAYNYNTPIDPIEFEREAKRILAEVEKECGWMYATLRTDYSDEAEGMAAMVKSARSVDEVRSLVINNTHKLGNISYTVWSDVFVCPSCSNDIVFYDVALEKDTGKVQERFACPYCRVSLTKRSMSRAWGTVFDKTLNQVMKQARQVPVLIHLTYAKDREEKAPDAFDIALNHFVENWGSAQWVPTNRMPEGEESRRNDPVGLTHVHHFYSSRAAITLSVAYALARSQNSRYIQYVVQQAVLGMARIARYAPGHYSQVNQYLSGTLYVGSQVVDVSLNYILANKINRLSKMLRSQSSLSGNTLVTTQSSTTTHMPSGSADYIFTDPPFGGNLMYSELNFLWEAWLKVFTNNGPEAIENRVQGKGAVEYQDLMERCFAEYYRVLKPGRWMTVEFHNSQDRIWNLIQEAILRAGFVIANVATLDKQQGTFKQVTSAGAVKQDLIISAYKPTVEMEREFSLQAGTETGVWDFIRNHLGQAPKPVFTGSSIDLTPERRNYLLFDRMVAFHIQRGVTVPMSASQFYAGLKQRFSERDGMYFLPEQAAEYDKARAKVQKVEQLSIFVTDEKSAILWVRNQLEQQKQTFGELQPKFMREGQPQKHERMPDLQKILDQSFLKDNEGRWYLPETNRQAYLERMREKDLLKEFEEYKAAKGRLKTFRTEAVRAGFAICWGVKDYATIMTVAKKLPDTVLQEDPALLMYYDNARIRLED